MISEIISMIEKFLYWLEEKRALSQDKMPMTVWSNKVGSPIKVGNKSIGNWLNFKIKPPKLERKKFYIKVGCKIAKLIDLGFSVSQGVYFL